MNPEITFGLALLGAVLGILNTWRAFDRDRIRLRVTPSRYISGGATGGDGWCVTVVNLSYLPVTLAEISFKLPGNRKWIHPRMRLSDGVQLPVRLEARTSVTAYFPDGMFEEPGAADAQCAQARTACGRWFTGSSKVFRREMKKLRAARKSKQ